MYVIIKTMVAVLLSLLFSQWSLLYMQSKDLPPAVYRYKCFMLPSSPDAKEVFTYLLNKQKTFQYMYLLCL